MATELLEQGVPAETVRGTMGWVSERKIATYSHTRQDAKLKAFDVLERVSPEPPAAAAPFLIDLVNPAVQAEIERQVQIVLQQERAKNLVQGGRVIRFPEAR